MMPGMAAWLPLPVAVAFLVARWVTVSGAPSCGYVRDDGSLEPCDSGGTESWIIAGAVLALVVLTTLVVRDWHGARSRLLRREGLRAERDRQATEALGSSFDLGGLKCEIAELYLAVQSARGAADDERAAELLGPDLHGAWRQRWRELRRRGLRAVVEVLDGPLVQLVEPVRREATGAQRVIVAVTATLRDETVDSAGLVLRHEADYDQDGRITTTEYWTLERAPADGWRLLAVDDEGAAT